MTFTIKGAVLRAGSLLRQGAVPLLLVTVVCQFLPLVAVDLGFHAMWDSLLHPGAFLSYSVVMAVSKCVPFVLPLINAFHMAAVTEIVMRTAAERPIRPAPLLLSALGQTFPVLGLYLFLLICLFGGGLVLVAPGIFLAAAFSLVVPVHVCERKGVIQAGVRSWRLTLGHRARIAVLWAVIGIGGYLASAQILFGDISAWLGMVLRLIPEGLLSPIEISGAQGFFRQAVGLKLVRGVIYTPLLVLNGAIYLSLRFQSSAGDQRAVETFE